MKNTLLTFLVLFFSAAAYSQNQLQVKIESGVCQEDMTIQFQYGDPMESSLGCAGIYVLDVNALIPESVTINGVTCTVNSAATVVFDNGVSGTVEFKRTGRHVGRVTFKAKEGAT